MKPPVIADDQTIINTQGIRFVECIDTTNYSKEVTYRLRVTYKGDVLGYDYPDKASRDAQYQALRAALTGETR